MLRERLRVIGFALLVVAGVLLTIGAEAFTDCDDPVAAAPGGLTLVTTDLVSLR